MSLNYRVSEWHQFENYECELCPFSTLDLPTMLAHQASRHAVFPDAPTPDKPRPESAPVVGIIDHPVETADVVEPAPEIKSPTTQEETE